MAKSSRIFAPSYNLPSADDPNVFFAAFSLPEVPVSDIRHLPI
jgi:hypothetical protein